MSEKTKLCGRKLLTSTRRDSLTRAPLNILKVYPTSFITCRRCSDTFQEQPEAQRSGKRKWASSFHENTIEVVQSIPLESTETYEAEYLDCSEQHFDPHDSYIEEQFSEEQEVKHNVYDYEPPTLSDSALQHLDIQPMNYQDYKEQPTNLSSDPLN
ncbi:uncharacterized protein LOC134221129 [Armigeres subalbatus]|uniref:uncharacterized protein LOC134221129 n=1 Tax=Armigeres subalbatus TaxID=124917 RepID=UPI002ED4F528